MLKIKFGSRNNKLLKENDFPELLQRIQTMFLKNDYKVNKSFHEDYKFDLLCFTSPQTTEDFEKNKQNISEDILTWFLDLRVLNCE